MVVKMIYFFKTAIQINSLRLMIVAFSVFLVGWVSVGGMFISKVEALTKTQKQVIDGNSLFFDVCDGTGSTSSAITGGMGGPADFSGNNNTEIAWNFFISQGFTPEQTAGIIGNLLLESAGTMDPAINQQGGGPGRGIAQWSVDERWQTLLNFASDNSMNPLHLETQLRFIMFELNGSENAALTALRTQNTIEGATESFMSVYERPGVEALDSRINYARQAFDLYRNNDPATDPPASGAPGSDSDALAGDDSEECGTEGGGGPGGRGLVNTEGYSFPLQGTKSELAMAGGSLPCNSGSGCHHDGTPAFDLIVTGDYNATIGRSVFAIHKGVVRKVASGYNDISYCYSIQFEQTDSQNPADDGWVYWYGHIKSPSVSEGQTVEAGTAIAVVGETECALNTIPHLHIDRGSPQGHDGGSDANRDAGIISLINSLYEDLP